MTATLHAADARVASRDPATGQIWRTYPVASADEVDAAVSRAREAQRAWVARPLAERVRLLDRFHDALFDRRAEVVALLTRENGKPAADGLLGEVVVVLDQARFYAQQAVRALRPQTVRPSSLALWRKRVCITHEPYGVVGVIAPWNYPLMLAAGVILPALAAGNAAVLKPSELTPATGLMLGELLVEAGAPHDLVTVLVGDGSTGAALCAAEVDKVFFVGSVATGRKVAEACARRLVPCVLELGGSDPALVLADADVRHAAVGIAWGRFSNAGQTCTAPKRVYVHERVYDRFVDELARASASSRWRAGRAWWPRRRYARTQPSPTARSSRPPCSPTCRPTRAC